MVKILFGGLPDENGQRNTRHDDLVARLRAEGHEVKYTTYGDEIMHALYLPPGSTSFGEDFNLVIYDSDVPYNGRYKNLSGEELIKQKTNRGIPAIGINTYPYNIDNVVETVRKTF